MEDESVGEMLIKFSEIVIGHHAFMLLLYQVALYYTEYLLLCLPFLHFI